MTEIQNVKKGLDSNQPNEKRYRGINTLLNMFFPDISYDFIINFLIECFPEYKKEFINSKSHVRKISYLTKLVNETTPSIQRIGDYFVRNLQEYSAFLKQNNEDETAQIVDKTVFFIENYVRTFPTIISPKIQSKYDDSEPVVVRKYKRMKVGINPLLRAYQKEFGIKKTIEIITQLTQYEKTNKPPHLKDLRKILSENEYTYDQLSAIMKSMYLNDKGSEELIENYNKHITIVEAISKKITDDFNQKKEQRKITRKERLELKKIRDIPAVAKLELRKKQMQRKKKEIPYVIPEEFMIKPTEPQDELHDPSIEEIQQEYRKYRASLQPEDPVEITPEMKENKRGVLENIEIFKDPIEVKIFLKQLKQQREFLLEHPFEHFEEKDNDLNVLLINEPVSQSKMEEILARSRDSQVCVVDGDPENRDIPVINYRYNQVGSWDDISDAIDEVFGNTYGFQAMKVHATFHIMIEYRKKWRSRNDCN
jgi:hypothetical protein